MNKLLTFISFFTIMLLGIAFFPDKGLGQSLVSGRVVDSLEQGPLIGAHIQLNTPQDSTIAETAAGEDGVFMFRGVAAGGYRIRVHFLGFESVQKAIRITEGEDYQAGLIRMKPAAITLEEIRVVDKPMPVRIKEDTTEFNAGAFTTQPYADADELIKKLPGVEVEPDGTVKSEGEEIRRVLVDGKEFFGNDPGIAMKNLPADIIDKVQIIDDVNEQSRFTGFDDGDRVRTMNIVTRADKRNGYFGRATANMGNSDRYNAGGNINYFKGDTRLSVIGLSNNVNQQNFSMQDLSGAMGGGGGRGGRGRGGGGGDRGMRNNDFFVGNNQGNTVTNSVGINYTDNWSDKLSVRGSYFYNGTNNDVDQLTNREYIIAGDDNQLNFQDYESVSKNYNHRVNLRMEYEIDSMNSVSFRPNISFQDFNRSNSTFSQTMLAGNQPVNSSDGNYTSDNNSYRFDGGLTYRHRFRKDGRTVSLDINGSSDRNEAVANNYAFNEYFEEGGDARMDTIDQLSNNLSDGWGFTSRLAYTEPLGASSRMQVNYSLRNTHSNADRDTYDYLLATGQYDQLNRDLTNRFRNDYLYHSGGLAYQFRKEKIGYELGLDYQRASLQNQRTFPDVLETSRTFTALLPEAQITYDFSDSRNLRFRYRTRTNAPSLNQLQDVIDNSNPLNLRDGNPDLVQEFNHNFSVRYRSFNRETSRNFFAFLSADFSSNKVVNSTFIARRDTTIRGDITLGAGGQYTRPENVDGYYAVRSFAGFGIPVEKLQLNLNFNTGLNYSRDIGLQNFIKTHTNNFGIYQGISVYSNINENIDYGLSTRINYNIIRNSLRPELNYNYYSQTVTANAGFIFWKGLRIRSDVNYNFNQGLSAGYDRQFMIWNAAVGYRLLKQRNAEITLSAFDLLNKNTNIIRNISEQYVEDVQTNILGRYFLLGFTYNLRKFGLGGEASPGRDMRGRFPGMRWP